MKVQLCLYFHMWNTDCFLELQTNKPRKINKEEMIKSKREKENKWKSWIINPIYEKKDELPKTLFYDQPKMLFDKYHFYSLFEPTPQTTVQPHYILSPPGN